jgi:hypothetical protein
MQQGWALRPRFGARTVVFYDNTVGLSRVDVLYGSVLGLLLCSAPAGFRVDKWMCVHWCLFGRYLAIRFVGS